MRFYTKYHKKDFIIAHTIFGADGIVIDIRNNNDATSFMDCNYWSCFVHEDERLLIGGLNKLHMETIRNVPDSENYVQYVKIINIFGRILNGAALVGIKPNTDDVSCFRTMIVSQVGGGQIQEKDSIPEYVQTLFQHFLQKQTEIMFNPGLFLHDHIKYEKMFGCNIYGFKKLKNLFMNQETVNFIAFIKLLPNIETFSVGHVRISGAAPSIALSHDFMTSILKCLDYLNTSTRSLSFSKFEIIRPTSSINHFIETNQHTFLQKGWTLRKSVFVGEGLYSNMQSDEVLSIEKLTNQ